MVSAWAAREVVDAWLARNAAMLAGFAGAFLHGSIVWLADDAELAGDSDVDLMIVVAGPLPTVKLGKVAVEGVLLDVTPIALAEVADAEAVLGNYHLAGSLRVPGILRDPSGVLAETHARVARDFAKREWVVRRCEDGRGRVLRNLDAITPDMPLEARVTSWLFGTGVTTHILLTAGLRNPTVRRRYETTRELLRELGNDDLSEWLLRLLGSDRLSAAAVASHPARLEAAFDAASATVRSPFFFASDLSQAARPLAIDGSRAMIARGSHREAIFWIAATYARCMTVFAQDGRPGEYARFAPGFRALLADLGVATDAEIVARAAATRAALPRVWDEAIRIVDGESARGSRS